MAVITNQLLPLYELVISPATVLSDFTHIRWFRSITGPDGPYEAMTAAAAAPASITGTALEPHALAGKTLSLLVDGLVTVDITFGGSDPYSTADAVSDILMQAGGSVTATDVDGRLQLESDSVGTGASIKILESEGALGLGFTIGDIALGVSADVAIGFANQYFFTDQNGSRSYWYRTQFVNNSTITSAPAAPPFPGTEVPVLAYSLTIPAYVQLVDLSGRPIEGRRIVIANVFLPNAIGDATIFRHSAEFITDENGRGEIRLVRGSVVDVHVEGTSYTRRITLPGVQDLADMVHLFDPSLSTDDEFGIQEPYIDFAIRMS